MPSPNHHFKALQIHAGPRAQTHLRQHGLRAQDVRAVPAAAGGPKGLVLLPLDEHIFGRWLNRSEGPPVHLLGASIGAWRMAAACADDPVHPTSALSARFLAHSLCESMT